MSPWQRNRYIESWSDIASSTDDLVVTFGSTVDLADAKFVCIRMFFAGFYISDHDAISDSPMMDFFDFAGFQYKILRDIFWCIVDGNKFFQEWGSILHYIIKRLKDFYL